MLFRQKFTEQRWIRPTHISVTFSLSWGDKVGMLVIPSDSRHWIMAKEHLQDDGQPPRTGAGARLSRGSTRSRTHTWAWGDSAILRKRIFWAGWGSWRWRDDLCGSPNKEAARGARSS